LLQPENGVYEQRSQAAQHQKAADVTGSRHLLGRIDAAQTADRPFDRETDSVEDRLLSCEHAIEISPERLRRERDENHEREILGSTGSVHK
jgi:hypothetical protein